MRRKTMANHIEDRHVLYSGTKKLPCRLTDREFFDRAEEMTGKMRRLSEIKDDKKATMKDFNARIESAEAEIERLRSILETRKETRTVEVESIAVFSENKVEEIRLDTMEVIGTWALEAHERQGMLEFIVDEEKSRTLVDN